MSWPTKGGKKYPIINCHIKATIFSQRSEKRTLWKPGRVNRGSLFYILKMALSSVQLIAAGDGSGNSTPLLRRTFSNSPLLHRSGILRKVQKESRLMNMDRNETRVRINVSGTIFETYEKTLAKFPKTLLGDKIRRIPYYDNNQQSLFFNRCRISFEAILFYYQSGGCLVRPVDKDLVDFEKECNFYGLSDNAIQQMKEREGYARNKPEKPVAIEKTIRTELNRFLEYPNSSMPARMFAIVSMATMVASVFMSCLSTVPSMRTRGDLILEDPLSLTEFAMNVFFGVEFILRFISAPKTLSFVKSPLNLIDSVAIFPYFVVFAIDETQVSNLGFIKAFRTIRVLRFLRFSRHSDTLRVVINILSSSIRDLFTVVFCMLLMSIVWGSLTYYVEVGTQGTQFVSIPEGMWWAIQTIVCLGYGDIVPVTLPGKIAAATAAAVGALTLTVPLLSIGGRYLQMYSRTFSIDTTLDINEEGNDNGQKTQDSIRNDISLNA